VHSAGIQDRVGARAVLIRLFLLLTGIVTVYADGGYSGQLIGWAQAMFGWSVKVVKRTEQHRFVVLPKRWVVERTFGWLNHSRRLSKDYEVTPSSAEAFVKIACIGRMVARLGEL